KSGVVVIKMSCVFLDFDSGIAPYFLDENIKKALLVR
ncbi:hypothetical protein OS145_10390, partial [Idiomarina baltica OS145]